MGLASALTTALTGLTAAETQIDVLGNNLANSQTVGFKASDTVFATQFLQTQGLGAAPTDNTGGTNPRQIGLGTKVAAITPDFTQGTIEVSSNPSDLAIQGDGFFVVQGSTGEQLYTRAGIFNTNSENQLVTVTGNRLLGYGVDELFQLQTTELVSLEIPLGSAFVAQPTQNVFMQGTLSPLGDIADTAEVLESAVLGNAAVPRPDVASLQVGVASVPALTGTAVNHLEGAGGTHAEGDTYRYRFAFVDNTGTESVASNELSVTVPAGNTLADNSIELTGLPTAADYADLNIYRTAPGGNDFFLLDTVPISTATYVDDNSVALSTTQLDESSLVGNYSYLITYHRAGEVESRPSPLVGPVSVVNGRVQISNLPTPPTPPAEGGFPAYNQVRVYRNLANEPNNYYLVSSLNPGETFTDTRSDADISDLSNPTNKLADLDGPKAAPNTLLTDLLRRDELTYEQLFEEGTLSFTARKGGRGLETKTFQIASTSTVQDLIGFMTDAAGIQPASNDPQNPIPNSLNNIVGETSDLSSGGSLQNGKIRIVSNNGADNALEIGLSAFQLLSDSGDVLSPNAGFGSIQEAQGNSAVTDFLVYDSLGTPLNVRVTAVLEDRDGSSTTYRWYADSPDNDPLSGADISVGTGLLTFDGEGNVLTASNSTVSIDRRNVPAASPLEFDLNFDLLTGLAVDQNSLAAARQDGSPAGSLTSFSIGEDGTIRGAFSNGISRVLGQVRMARFTNPVGLEQRGENMFAEGANSGLPVEGNPGQNGLGTIIAGAVELSNTDVGQNLIDLVLATTQYRGNTRIITAAQQLFDELLNLRR